MPEARRYALEPYNRFFEANRRIVEFEVRPGNTVTFICEVDLTQAQRLRQEAGEQRPSYTAIVAKAVGLALREFPYANRRVARRAWLPLASPRLQRFERCDIGVAVERDVPGAESVAYVDVLRDADRQSLGQINDWLRELAASDAGNSRQWREFTTLIQRLPRWLAALLVRLPYFLPSLWPRYRGAAALISSPSKYGIDAVVATWSWPLGISFGYVKPRPIVRDGQVVAAATFQLVLNFDRRVMAGAQAARFFRRICDLIEKADRLSD
jgi:pyruvate/2-oxoglutarate dehydrogenase complex dihydrolipoamide acyltransferase (E2) component